jgi:hypothetical protein
MFVLFMPSMLGQALSFVNSSNAALGMDLVSGDSFLLTITGVAPNKPVTMNATKNGVPLTPFNAGSTDSSGNFTLTGTETDFYVSEYTEQWYVDGVAIGPLLEFEVIYKPAGLTVTSVDLASFPSPACTGLTYGIFVDIGYQVTNQNGLAVTSTTGVPLIPTEDVKFGSSGWIYDREIGPDPGYPTSNRFVDENGRFHDVPVGTCTNFPFSVDTRQVISIRAGNNEYLVRGDTVFTKSSASPGHGFITNGSDVSKSR